jgi:hypothetical protein
VYDQAGRLVVKILDHQVSPGIYNAELNTAGYLPGIYLCVIETVNGKITQPFIVK